MVPRCSAIFSLLALCGSGSDSFRQELQSKLKLAKDADTSLDNVDVPLAVEASRCSQLLRAKLGAAPSLGPVIDMGAPSMVTAWLLREKKVVISVGEEGRSRPADAATRPRTRRWIWVTQPLELLLTTLREIREPPSLLFIEADQLLQRGALQRTSHTLRSVRLLQRLQARSDAGTIYDHPTRQPLTKKLLTNAMGNVQRMLLLPGGANGGWSQEAEERLEKLLAKPLVSKVSKPLPIEDAAPLAIEDGQQDADDSSSESSSDSDSSSDQCMTTEEVEKAMKYKGDQSAKAKVEFESIFFALHHCQEELADAKSQIKEQDVEIAVLQGLLEESRAVAAGDDEDDDEMGMNSD